MLIINSFLFQAKDENVSAMWEDGHYYTTTEDEYWRYAMKVTKRQ